MAPDEASRSEQVSAVVAAWNSQDPGARDRMLPLVHGELRRLAQHYTANERLGHTLQATALLNEVYLRLGGLDRMQWRDRAHFIAMAATLVRRVLVDYARDRAREKRGGGVSITSRIVELRFFGGLTVDETAAARDISPSTVKREWASARAWLYREPAGA